MKFKPSLKNNLYLFVMRDKFKKVYQLMMMTLSSQVILTCKVLIILKLQIKTLALIKSLNI